MNVELKICIDGTEQGPVHVELNQVHVAVDVSRIDSITSYQKTPEVPRVEVPKPEAPQFENDFPDCVFLGRFQITASEREESYDLYSCHMDCVTTVIARYGDEHPEYLYGFGRKHPALVEAERRYRLRRSSGKSAQGL